MKLKEVERKDIFYQLYNNKSIPNVDMFDDNENLDFIYYYQHSGEKTISPLYEQINDTTKLAKIILTKFNDKWNHIYEALKEEYNPIHNYNMEEELTRDLTNSTKGTNSSEGSSNNNGVVNEQVYGFNSTEAVDSNKSNGTNSSSYNSSDTNSKDTTYKGSEKTIRKGNIGVTTSQKMLSEELEVRKYLFYDMIMNDIDSLLTLQIYE